MSNDTLVKKNDTLVKKFRPFDLDAAMAGAKVITEAGDPVRIVCWDTLSPRPLLCLVKNSNGAEGISTNNYDGSGDSRLFMAPVEVVKYTRVLVREGLPPCVLSDMVDSPAQVNLDDINGNPVYLATVTWEE